MCMIRHSKGMLFSPSLSQHPRQGRFSSGSPTEDVASNRAWLDMGASNLMLALPAGTVETDHSLCTGGMVISTCLLKNIPLGNGLELQSRGRGKLGCCLIPRERWYCLGQDGAGWARLLIEMVCLSP